jgi:hypothetical protein
VKVLNEVFVRNSNNAYPFGVYKTLNEGLFIRWPTVVDPEPIGRDMRISQEQFAVARPEAKIVYFVKLPIFHVFGSVGALLLRRHRQFSYVSPNRFFSDRA